MLDTDDVHIQLTDSGNVAARVGANGTAMVFGVDGSNGTTERLRITNAGNVGINTASPSQLLHLGGATNKGIQITSSTSNAGYLAVYQNESIFGVNRDPSDGSFADTGQTAQFIALQSGNGQGFIKFATTATNNIEPTEKLRILGDGGITFNGDTTAANALDDYEEGTHNTTISFSSGGSVTTNSNTFSYTKIGQSVSVSGYIYMTGVSSPAGIMKLTLPFPLAAGVQFRASANIKFNGLAAGTNVTESAWGAAEQNSSIIDIYVGSGTSVAGLTGERLAAGSDMRVSVTYITSA